MEIRINGQTADITADAEKNVGEVIAGLNKWLDNSGHRLSGFALDGRNVSCEGSSMEEAFSRDISTVNILDIYTNSMAELAGMSLLQLRADIDEYENLDYAERREFYDRWKQSPQAVFAAEQIPDIFTLSSNAFQDGGINARMLRAIIEERLREIENPAAEFESIKTLVSETCARLVDLPLDIQTGKDGRAAQTIQAFSSVSEKIFRIFKLSNNYANESPVANLIGKFNASARELSDAYERHDIVLVGDLAEYEMAPRLQELYATIANINLQSEVAN
ncbi:MAG: hypothetical protein LBU82_02370 [Treponema sp.]|jgi:hypothetical protein|nr:hypothetical protein [Treponema sp.]